MQKILGGGVFNSASYWENRYRKKGNSGAGSYGALSEFKAQVINDFVEKNKIESVIEWGCGDGNQLRLARYPKYLGFDVSKTAVKLCKKIFKKDKSKKFVWCGSKNFSPFQTAQLSLSLDVIYHLVEDEVFENYMQRLFASSEKYVCIYSCDTDYRHALHVRCRKFTNYVKEHFSNWVLEKKVDNAYPYDATKPDETSFSDFYFYKKIKN